MYNKKGWCGQILMKDPPKIGPCLAIAVTNTYLCTCATNIPTD